MRLGGGKRVRPALLLLAARLFGPSFPGAVSLAVVVELVHTATLVHDDIIDGADIRRGRPTANVQWSTAKCVLSGDWMYMQAFQMALSMRDFRILDVLTNLTQQMVEGELLQQECLGHQISRDTYMSLIERKTATLFSACMRLGSIVGRAPAEVEQKVAAYGHHVGMAFQLIDDALDFTASEQTLGKPVCSDLREGKMTLPVIHALQRCTDADRRVLNTIVEDRGLSGTTQLELFDILNRYRAFDAVNEEARAHTAAAAAMLADLPDSEAKRTLSWIPEFLVTREC